MSEEYRVICDWFMCWTAGMKARRIEAHLNRLSAEGWSFVALNPFIFLGFDVGFYLVLKTSAGKPNQ